MIRKWVDVESRGKEIMRDWRISVGFGLAVAAAIYFFVPIKSLGWHFLAMIIGYFAGYTAMWLVLLVRSMRRDQRKYTFAQRRGSMLLVIEPEFSEEIHQAWNGMLDQARLPHDARTALKNQAMLVNSLYTLDEALRAAVIDHASYNRQCHEFMTQAVFTLSMELTGE